MATTIEGIEFLVLEFEKKCGKSEMEVFPDNWYDDQGKQCILYPAHYKSERVLKAVKCAEEPTDEWLSYPIKKEWYRSHVYEKASKRCEKLLYTSSVETSDEEDDTARKRVCRKPLRFVDTPSPVPSKVAKRSNSKSSQQTFCSVVDDLPIPPLPLTPTIRIANIRIPDRTATENHSSPERQRDVTRSTPRRENTSPTTSIGNRSSPQPERDPRGPAPSPSAAGGTSNDNGFQSRVFRMLELILEKQRTQDAVLRKIAERQQIEQHPDAGADETDLPPIPCRNTAALRHLDTVLRDSEAARKKLIRILSLVGGRHLKAGVENVMKELMTHEVSREYNITGAKGKKALTDLEQIWKHILKCVRLNSNLKKSTDQEIKIELGKWFTNSRDRNGGRKIRLSTKDAAASTTVATLNNEQENDIVGNAASTTEATLNNEQEINEQENDIVGN